MSTENNNLFTDFEPLKGTGMMNAKSFLASEPLSGLTDSISPQFQGLIPEPTDALFDKMWESCDPQDFNSSNASTPSLSGRKEIQPLSPDAFMTPSTVLKGRGSAPVFDDVLPEQNRPSRFLVQQPQNAPIDEVAYFEQLWNTGDFPEKEKSEEQILWESKISNAELTPLVDEKVIEQSQNDAVDIPQLLTDITNAPKPKTQRKPELTSDIAESKPAQLPVKTGSVKKSDEKKSDASKSNSGWTLSLISCLTALIVGLFLFGWNMLPAYLVQYQIQQATGMSLRLKNVTQDYRAGMTSVESVQAFDSAQRPFFETGHAVFSTLPYFVGDNKQMKWAMVEGIRFAPSPSHVSSVNISLTNNEFNKALKSVEKELNDSQIDLLVKNSVSTISSPYEQTIRVAQQEVKDITKQIQVLQERLLASGEEATDADKAQATSYQQRMQIALNNMSIEESCYNQRNAALLNNLRSKRNESRAELNIPAVTHGDVTEYLFGQDYMEFTGLLLYEIRQFCRWLPADLEKALGPADKLDPSSLSFRRIATQEQLGVGQIRLTGQTQFMNQTVPFSAVISNYSTEPNGKPLTLDIAFGEDQSARLRLEARRGEKRTEIMVEFASSNVNPGTQFGLEEGLHVKLEPDEKTPFIQTRSIQFIVADGRIQGEYAMAQTAPIISLGVSGVRSENNVARLQELVQSVDKITLNGTISGRFAKPELRVSSNLESWGHTVLSIAANEYDMRMDAYRAAIKQKSEEAIENEQKRIAKIAEDVKISANGNALLLNQLSSGAVDSQIVVDQTPANVEQEKLPELPALEIQEEKTETETIAESNDELTLPSLEELSTNEIADEQDSPAETSFPELPVPVLEFAQPSAQVAGDNAIQDELPSIENNDAKETTVLDDQVSQFEELPELPMLPNVEEILPVSESAIENENPAVSQSQAFGEEELAPQTGVPLTGPQIGKNDNDSEKVTIRIGQVPTELNGAPANAMEINSPEANYESPKMEFWDDDNMNGSNSTAPLEEALPVEGVVYLEPIPSGVSNTVSNVPRRTTPPAPPIVIDEE